jgi:hypothetical protein
MKAKNNRASFVYLAIAIISPKTAKQYFCKKFPKSLLLTFSERNFLLEVPEIFDKFPDYLIKVPEIFDKVPGLFDKSSLNISKVPGLFDKSSLNISKVPGILVKFPEY